MNWRRIDPQRDAEFVLEMHCIANHASESEWAHEIPFAEYRAQWFSSPQPIDFLGAVESSLSDSRTLCEVWEADGAPIGFLWVTFVDVVGYALTIAEINDVAVTESARRRGIGSSLLEYAETEARARGASVLRSEVAVENVASVALHERAGLRIFKGLYEKRL